MSDNKELICTNTKGIQVSSQDPLESKNSLISDSPLFKIKIINAISIDASRRKKYKNKFTRSINIYPNPDQKIKNQIKPIKLNFDIIKTTPSSNKNILPKAEYYFPIIEKEHCKNKIFPQLGNNNRYLNNSKNGIFPKLNFLKHNLLSNKFDEKYKSTIKNRNKLPNFQYPINMVGISDYVNDTNFNNELIETQIKSSRDLKPINSYSFRKKDIIQEEIDRKKKIYKQQYLLRGKYQYCKRYDRCKSNAFVEEKEKESIFDNDKDTIEKNMNVKQISNLATTKERNLNLEADNEHKIADEEIKHKDYNIKPVNYKEYEKLKYNLMGDANVVLPEDIQLKAVDS